MPCTRRAVRQRETSRTSCRVISPFSHSQGAARSWRRFAPLAASAAFSHRHTVMWWGPA